MKQRNEKNESKGKNHEKHKSNKKGDTLQNEEDENEDIYVTTLGAGQDIGRSCIIVKVGGKVIMFDCGYHMAFKDERKYPNFSLLFSNLGKREDVQMQTKAEFLGDSASYLKKNEDKNDYKKSLKSMKSSKKLNNGEFEETGFLANNEVDEMSIDFTAIIDCVIITHFHLDHSGALPYFTEKLKYRGPIYMTYPTKALSPVLLCDACRITDFVWEKKRMQIAYERYMRDTQKAADYTHTVNSTDNMEDKSFYSAILSHFPSFQSTKMSTNSSFSAANSSFSAANSSFSAANSSSDFSSKSSHIPRTDPYSYTEKDVYKCMERVTTLQLHETFIQDESIYITPYYAGHVLGASMFHVQVKSKSILYTGDYNTVPDRHLGSAEIPKIKFVNNSFSKIKKKKLKKDINRVDLLISECTYSTHVKLNKKMNEKQFCNAIKETLDKNGSVLIPVFAVGRAQELYMLLETFWKKNENEMKNYKIYCGGGMTEKANLYYKLYTNWTKIDANIYDAKFEFSYINTFDKDKLACLCSKNSSSSTPSSDVGMPYVLFATPGMLHGGLALTAFKALGSDEKNMVIIPGYCVQGTIGNKLIAGEKKIRVDSLTTMDVKCKVRYMSFSAHADTLGIQQLIKGINPLNVMLVHGEKEGMMKLKYVLQRNLGITVFTPSNGETIRIDDQNEKFKEIFVYSESLEDIIIKQNSSYDNKLQELLQNSEDLFLMDKKDKEDMINDFEESKDILRNVSSSEKIILPNSFLFSFISIPDSTDSSIASSILKQKTAKQKLKAVKVNFLITKKYCKRKLQNTSIFGDNSIFSFALTEQHICRLVAENKGRTLEASSECLVNIAQKDDACCRSYSLNNNSLYSLSEFANKYQFYSIASINFFSKYKRHTFLSFLNIHSIRFYKRLKMKINTFKKLIFFFFQKISHSSFFNIDEVYIWENAQIQPKNFNIDHYLDTYLNDFESASMAFNGVMLCFASLILVHNGISDLHMQWSYIDDKKESPVFVLVEYLSELAEK